MIDGEHRARGLTQQYVKSNNWHVLIILETFSPTNRAMFQSCEPAEEPARLVVQANDKEGIDVSLRLRVTPY